MKGTCKLATILSCIAICLNPAMGYGFCFEEAGRIYNLPPTLLLSIARQESNLKPDAINRNLNGSYDFGLMQINSSWAKRLGPELWSQLGDPCTNLKVGAWILRQCINDYGYGWKAVGCYNSRTPGKNERYAQRIAAQLANHSMQASLTQDGAR
ncbi:lytic transglycosylase domain-containing protein [Trichlorobacter lovleyi]|jgi:Soluble lytic murein transglycosylase and related regulatory proteins (some contain LysM/invasin domains)|uniref:Lytic transglycosylase catalytic n=1 Tax=Trichlorobacter lovleyi (strain ATCC BAA-1151 / DSM 17278 / SZ) TaxID=398767 RepID=B3E5L6_TRIL1|nr:lytic transglycosylase domain-containing protein [Trichlorobacter lovleyi]ACD94687.1 Lytic transglycosylase catalytic [Trichlorobacter lovleyi SZ]